MAVTVQQGTLLQVGFRGNTYDGYFMDTFSIEQLGDIAEVRDENDATATKIISNQGTRRKLAMVVKNGSDPTTMQKGEGITINTVVYMVEDATINYSRGAARVEVTVIKEDSMTYSPSPTSSP